MGIKSISNYAQLGGGSQVQALAGERSKSTTYTDFGKVVFPLAPVLGQFLNENGMLLIKK
jgi:hypothetical protein